MKAGLVIVALIGALSATGYKAARNEIGRSNAEEGRSIASWTLDAAQKDGVLITALDVEPASVRHEGHEVVIQEAWIEHYAVYRYRFVWFHERVPSGGFVIVLRPASRVSPEIALWPEGSGASFTWRGGLLFSFYSESKPELPLTVVASHGRDKIPVFVLREANKRVEATSGTRPEI